MPTLTLTDDQVDRLISMTELRLREVKEVLRHDAEAREQIERLGRVPRPTPPGLLTAMVRAMFEREEADLSAIWNQAMAAVRGYAI
jgi:hypothetical protein